MKLNRGVKWRAYDDGVVVYVPATCETHVLAPEFVDVVRPRAPGSLEPAVSGGRLAADINETPPSGASDQVIDELIALKILDAGN